MSVKIAIIGAGKMGMPMHQSLSTEFSSENVVLCDRTTDVRVLHSVDVVIFAVKPQDFEACIKGITVDLSKKIILSIMAGVSLERLQALTHAAQIVRSIPNVPLQVGAGFTPWVATKEVIEKNLIRRIFGSFGVEMELATESQLDAVAPLSGSGPAYFFYLCELLEQKALRLGFSPTQARQVAEQTFIGSAQLLAQKKQPALDLRKAVTSKGGSTEASFLHLEKNHFAEIFDGALDAAFNHWRQKS